MKRKIVSGIMLPLLFICMLTLAFNIQPAKASGTIYIRADGSVEPEGTPISSIDNITYTFTGNIINDSIVVKRDNIVVDGAGYALQGTGNGTGIDLTGRSNVTIKNIEIKAFGYGIRLSSSSNNNAISSNNITANQPYGIGLFSSSNNAISGNNIKNNWDGIRLVSSSNNNAISSNNITANNAYGIQLYDSSNNAISSNNITANSLAGIRLQYSSNNAIFHNNFNNWLQVYIDTPGYANFWDNGYPSGGNYWSDHNPPDIYSGPYQNETGRDGIGDTPYVIDGNNRDRYPLISPYGYVPSPDVNGDGRIDIKDIGIVTKAFGSHPGDPRWNPYADVNQDGIIDIYDLVLIAINFGKKLPL